MVVSNADEAKQKKKEAVRRRRAKKAKAKAQKAPKSIIETSLLIILVLIADFFAL